MKKICLVLVLLIFSSLLCMSCDKGDKNKVQIWTEDATVKILQDKQYSDKNCNEISLSLAKNESEGAQIIISPKEKDIKYNVEVSDLYSNNSKISKENIFVYAEKYSLITTKFNRVTEFPEGSKVPDALIPIEKIVEYGENTVEKNKNQGVFIDVRLNDDVFAGQYLGKIKIIIDNSYLDIPLKVTVWDFALPDIPTSMNYWGMFNRDHFGTAEMDSSDDIAEKYFTTLLEYKVNSELPFVGVGGTERYVELLRKYYNYEGFSCYRFYYELKNCVYNGKLSPFDCFLLKDYLKAVVVASMEDKINYLDKAIFYFLNLIDEPKTQADYEKVKLISNLYEEILVETDKELKQELISYSNYNYYASVISPTLLSIPNVLPEITVTPKYELENTYGVKNITHCIQVNAIDGESARADFASSSLGYWFYSCGTPVNPYPTNHIDDYLLSFRILSWEQKAYGINGYLNWAAAFHLQNNSPILDPYTNGYRAEGKFPAGDGFIFYPGAPYGIYGPVPSMRAIAFRDGVEDFEYLTILEDAYAAMGVDTEGVLNEIYNRLFTGVITTTDSNEFYNCRKELAELILEADNPQDILYDSITINNGIAKVIFKVVNSDYAVYYNGEKIESNLNEKYEVFVDLSKTTDFKIKLVSSSEEKIISKKIVGGYCLVSDFEDEENIININSQSAKFINSDLNYVQKGNKSLKIMLQGKEAPYNHIPFFGFNTDVIESGNLNNIKNISIAIYNADTEKIKFTLKYYMGNQYVYVKDYELETGWNEVVINNVYMFQNLDNIEGFYFMTDNFYQNNGKLLYLDNMYYTLI